MRILLFADIHSNKFAINSIENEKFDEAIFLGDIVDYGPNPAETLDMVRRMAKYLVMGNHDYAAAFNKDCLCSEENHELSVYTRENITLQELGKEDIQFLRSIPQSLELEINGITFTITHGSPANNLYGYMFPWDLKKEDLKTFTGRSIEKGFVLVGHTHYQFMVPFNNVIILNPGSSGQPRDYDNRPSYAIIDTDKGTIEMKRFNYNKEALKKEIESKIMDKDHMIRLEKLFRLV